MGVAITLVCGYGLLTRLFPDRLGVIQPIGNDRLSEPLRYWNALGIFAAIGALVALGVASRARGVAVRALAGAAVPVLLTALYFSYSRGAWLALGGGLLAAFALDPRRLQLATASLAVGSWAVLAVFAASRAAALTHSDAPLRAAAHDGHHLAALLAGLCAVSAAAAVVLALAERRILVRRPVRLAYGGALTLAAIALLLGAFSRYGSPSHIVSRAYDSVTAPLPETHGNLNKRLFSLSSNQRIDHWKVAWQVYRDHPWLGSGPGTFHQEWLARRTTDFRVLDAHSLYLETLAELGPLGLALLVATLAVPLLAALRARRHALVPAALGGYVAFLLHAGIDWDWEMPAVTLAGLLCGCAILVAAGFALVGLIGNSAIAASDDATAKGNLRRAQSQAEKARSWAPWSSYPLQRLGELQLGRGQRRKARDTLRLAIAKDPHQWALWLDLAFATRGRAQSRAFAKAARLDPRNEEVARMRALVPLGRGRR